MDLTGLVKPLEWQVFGDRGAKASAWLQANYMIQKWSDGRYDISASYPGYSSGIDGAERWHPSLEAAQSAAQADYAARALATIDTDKIAALVDAVDLAANRLHSLSVEFDTGTRLFIEAGEWADDARAALSAFKGETP